ncbi:hypothetical protein SUGI_0669790 [Cryptomeria japonica]|nr:hypothetical protein SUGI_0669790 [Cryptomeria japonica]
MHITQIANNHVDRLALPGLHGNEQSQNHRPIQIDFSYHVPSPSPQVFFPTKPNEKSRMKVKNQGVEGEGDAKSLEQGHTLIYQPGGAHI